MEVLSSQRSLAVMKGMKKQMTTQNRHSQTQNKTKEQQQPKYMIKSQNFKNWQQILWMLLFEC